MKSEKLQNDPLGEGLPWDTTKLDCVNYLCDCVIYRRKEDYLP